MRRKSPMRILVIPLRTDKSRTLKKRKRNKNGETKIGQNLQIKYSYKQFLNKLYHK